MKRGYTALEYKSTIRQLRAVRPGISLSSDFIVGFPGETEEDFAQDDGADRRRRLRQLLQLRLQHAPGHPGRGAARRHAAGAEARAAAAAAGHASRPTCARISASRVGTVQRILVEGPSRKDAAGTDGPHRMQPHRQLRRRPAGGAAGRADARRDDHRRRCRIRCAACRSTAPTASAPPGPEAPPPQRDGAGQHHARHRWPSCRRGPNSTRPGQRDQRARRAGRTGQAAPAHAGQVAPPQQLGAAQRPARPAPSAGTNRLARCQRASSGPIVVAGFPERARPGLTRVKPRRAAKPTIVP